MPRGTNNRRHRLEVDTGAATVAPRLFHYCDHEIIIKIGIGDFLRLRLGAMVRFAPSMGVLFPSGFSPHPDAV